VKPRKDPPRLLLGARSLDGLSRASNDRLIEVGTRYREPESLAVTLSKAMDAGAEAVLAAPSPTLRAALAELRRVVPIAAVLPALDAHDRSEFEPDLDTLIQRRQRVSGAGTRMRGGLAGLGRLPLISRDDWTAQLPELIELEVAAVKARELAAVVLAVEITDRALAAGQRALFDSFCRFVRGRFRVNAAFETRNLGWLLARLDEWQIVPDFVVGPVNPRGLGMKPTPEETLDRMRGSSIKVVASEVRAGGLVPLAEGARYAKEHGAYGVVPDLTDLDDVAVEMKALKG